MIAHLRDRLHDDEGISLVEIMVSIVLLAVALTAFAGTITSALATINADEQFVRGNQVAADLLEQSRATSWPCTGLDPSAPGYNSSGPGGEPTATVAPTCTVSAANRPSQSVTVDGQVYDATRHIVWVDDASVPGTQDHKRITIVLVWSFRGRPYTTTTSSTRAPTATEVPIATAVVTPACTPGAIVSFSASPGNVRISPSGLTAEAIAVSVEVCPGASGVTLTPSPLASRALVQQAGSGGAIWTTSFPVGTPNFTPGNRTWNATSGASSATAPITFYQAAALPQLEIISFALSGPLCVRSNRSELYNATTVTVVVRGMAAASEGSGSVSWTAANRTVSATFSGLSNGNSVWTATMAANTLLTGTSTTVSAQFTRSQDNASAVGTMSPTPPVQRTSNAGQCT